MYAWMNNSANVKTDEAINILNNELAGIKNSIDAMHPRLNIIIAIVIVYLPAIIYLHQRPALTITYNNYPKSESTSISTLTSMFQNLATGKGLKVATEGETAIAYVNVGGEGYLFTETRVTCQLMSESRGDVTKCSAQHIMMTNQFEISYQPTIASRGRHQLHIKVDGEHIKASPFTVTVIRKIGAPIKIIDKMAAPQGIALSQQNEKIVAEYQEHRIAIFSPSLDSVERFGLKGSGPGEFNHPCGVVVDDDGNILVADQKNNRIQKFNSRGEYIGNHNIHSLELGLPVGIGIHPHTKMIYVTDTKHHRVQILHPNLNYSGSFGSLGNGDGLLSQPKDVAFDSAGNVYVADNENHRIQVFSKTGQYLRKFGRQGNEEGELYYPSSISIDCEDVIYMTELYNNRVSMFTLQGEFLHSFGSKGNGEGKFMHPCGIKVDKNGTIYVSDHDNDRIQVF